MPQAGIERHPRGFVSGARGRCESEAVGQWFRRNVAALMGEGRAHSDLLSVRAMTLLSPSSTVVDVGASSGWRAAAIEKAAGAAVEPSADAIQCGRWWREDTTLDGIRQEKLYY